MITVLESGAKNVVYFKDARAVMNANALTFVRGLNLDSDPAAPTGNGAGKSLFFSTLPTAVYASPPTTSKKKAKKILLAKNSVIDFTVLGTDGHKYRVEQTATKYKIFKDGVDIEIRTVPLAEEYIRTVIFPLQAIDYYTYGFLSTLKPYPLRSADDTTRLEHFSQLFRLGDYDSMRLQFTKQLRSIKDSEIKLATLEQSALSLRTKLKKVKKSVSKTDLTEARAVHKKLESVIQEQVQAEFDLNTLRNTLKTLLTVEKELDELRGKYVYKDHPSARLAILKSQKALAKKWDSFNSLRAAYDKSVKSTQEKIDQLKLPKEGRKELESQLDDLTKKKDRYEKQSEELEEKKDQYDRLLKQAKPVAEELASEHDVGKDDTVDLKTDHTPEIEACRARLRLKTLLEHKHREGNNCPTCMSEVDIENIRKVVKQATKELPALEKKKEAQDLFRKLRELRTKVKDLKFDPNEFKAVKEKEEQNDGLIEACREKLRILKRHAELKSVLADIEKPTAPKEKPDTDLSYSKLDKHIELCNQILSHVASKDKLLENNPQVSNFRTVKAVREQLEQTDAKIELAHAKLTKDRRAMAEASSVIDKQASYRSEFDLYTKELKESTDAIAKLKPSIDDKKVLETLIRAYSSKGLKTIVANQRAEALETNLNHARHLIFSEPFTFSVSASDSGLSIMVDRNNGMISDVRELSGAESNCFNLLCMYAILAITPDERRLNMVVLDEPTAHMDKASAQLFIERFLPALMEVVPNVYVITPNDEYLNGSSEWIVRKSRGVATLITSPLADLQTIKETVEAKSPPVAKPKTRKKKR